MAHDIKAIKAESNLTNGDGEEWDCEYIEYSTVPDQTGGAFWSVLNRLFIRESCESWAWEGLVLQLNLRRGCREKTSWRRSGIQAANVRAMAGVRFHTDEQYSNVSSSSCPRSASHDVSSKPSSPSSALLTASGA